MPAADYERAMLKVRAHVASKSSHGRDELLREIARIESECELSENEGLFDARPLPHVGGEYETTSTTKHGAASEAQAA